ncbi:hypothetical protein OSB04_028105 [Centaurea solstitialis]|uniref:Putative plant transposon protein domain-containing protein n=1 Tax=Centaurea solstitialis TaxID=347529 RepID=A0AA38SGL6_9ASTR|nr:hypothetical protein OSB04_028105 [Centaurea solstitialis]
MEEMRIRPQSNGRGGRLRRFTSRPPLPPSPLSRPPRPSPPTSSQPPPSFPSPPQPSHSQSETPPSLPLTTYSLEPRPSLPPSMIGKGKAPAIEESDSSSPPPSPSVETPVYNRWIQREPKTRSMDVLLEVADMITQAASRDCRGSSSSGEQLRSPTRFFSGYPKPEPTEVHQPNLDLTISQPSGNQLFGSDHHSANITHVAYPLSPPPGFPHAYYHNHHTPSVFVLDAQGEPILDHPSTYPPFLHKHPLVSPTVNLPTSPTATIHHPTPLYPTTTATPSGQIQVKREETECTPKDSREPIKTYKRQRTSRGPRNPSQVNVIVVNHGQHQSLHTEGEGSSKRGVWNRVGKGVMPPSDYQGPQTRAQCMSASTSQQVYRIDLFSTDLAREMFPCFQNKLCQTPHGFLESQVMKAPEIKTVVDTMEWDILSAVPGPYNLDWVRDFYTEVSVTSGFQITVRGTPVDYSSESFNQMLGLPQPKSLRYGELMAHTSDSDLSAILKTIANEGTTWEIRGRNRYFKSKNLKPIAGIWSFFVRHTLMPARSDTDLDMDRVIIVYCILKGYQFDVGKIISHNINKINERSYTKLLGMGMGRVWGGDPNLHPHSRALIVIPVPFPIPTGEFDCIPIPVPNGERGSPMGKRGFYVRGAGSAKPVPVPIPGLRKRGSPSPSPIPGLPGNPRPRPGRVDRVPRWVGDNSHAYKLPYPAFIHKLLARSHVRHLQSDTFSSEKMMMDMKNLNRMLKFHSTVPYIAPVPSTFEEIGSSLHSLHEKFAVCLKAQIHVRDEVMAQFEDLKEEMAWTRKDRRRNYRIEQERDRIVDLAIRMGDVSVLKNFPPYPQYTDWPGRGQHPTHL